VPRVTRWQRYWFADGGRYAAAIVRIAIALAVLLSLAKLGRPLSTGDVPGAHTLYRPVGIWMLFGHWAPGEMVVTLLRVVAWGSTACMCFGFRSRTSTAISFVAAVAVAALSYASTKTWSHQYNVVFIAQFAFLGARSGDVLSVDALIRRVRGLPEIDVARGYQWSLRLVQLAVALMFAGAAFHKLAHGHFTLRWALSDSLRNHLLVAFDLADLPRPALANWIIDDPWRYRTVACLNLVSQMLPLVACFVVRRPWLRAACGGFFAIETIALGLVVDLWNLHWLPLYAVFVDWDRLIGWLRPALVTPAEVPTGWKPPRNVRIFVIGFVVYDAVTAFVPALDQTLNTYPFSGFPMFATVRARAPYDEHLPYAVAADHFAVTADQAIEVGVQRWFDHANRGMFTVRNPVELKKRLTALLAQAQRRYPKLGIHAVRSELAIFESPAYPAPAHFDMHVIATLGEVRDDGTFRTLLGKLDDGALTLAPVGLDASAATLAYYRDDAPVAIPLDAPRNGASFRVGELAGDPLYVVATVDSQPWLVATYEPWHWQ